MRFLLVLAGALFLVGCISPSTTEISYEIQLESSPLPILLKRVELINSKGASSTAISDKNESSKLFTGSFLLHGTKKNFILLQLQDSAGYEWEEGFCINPNALKATGEWSGLSAPNFKCKLSENWNIMNNPDKYFKNTKTDGVSKLKFKIDSWKN